MNAFPQSTLCDVYKFCFQDRFGLEHLLSDSIAAVRYIEYELRMSDTADWSLPLFHYNLLNGNYVRVDINYVRKGIVPVSVLVSAMLESVRREGPVTGDRIAKWKEEWKTLRDALLDVYPLPHNFVEDSEKIDTMLASDHYAVHHSDLFNKTYRQHYRIVRKDVFDQMIWPLINSNLK